MIFSRLRSKIALACFLVPYCLAARANPIAELETRSVSFGNPPTPQNPFLLTPQLSQNEEIAVSDRPMVLPRIGATFKSGPEVGYGSSFGSLYAFVPFAQTSDRSTFFTEGRLNFFTHDGEYGGNVRFGYRTLLPDSNLVLGGYLGYDARRTEFEETFHQLGLGFDLQGEDWEVRANGYFPIGSRRREVANDSFDSGTIISNLRFSGYNLLFSRFRQTTISRLVESSVTGFDIEGGYRLLSWETGSLYAHGGLYYLDVPGNSDFVGVRGRLQAQIDDIFQAGVALQSDGNFGTNVSFNVGVTFGGSTARKKEETPAESLLARLGNGVSRQEIIAIDRQTEFSTTTNQEDNVVAINPSTGQAWRFVHVTGGATGGSGTVESPFGQVTDAVAIAQSNDIVYVDAGTNPGMDGFTIPSDVQVLSTALTRSIDYQVTTTLGGTETFSTQLPGSGTGTLPLINGTVATNALGGTGGAALIEMGSNSVLSGFDIQPATTGVSGVGAAGASGFTVEENQISAFGASGVGIVVLSNIGETSSNITLSNNTIANTQSGNSDSGIVLNNSGGTISNVTISGNTISTTGINAAGIIAFATAGITDNIFISDNTTNSTNTDGHGVVVFSPGGTATNLNINNNSFTTSGTSAVGLAIISTMATSNTCIASFTGNTLNNLAASDDITFTFVMGTISFVGLDSVPSNNTGFDSGKFTGSGTVTQVSSC
ncbi:MAG: inverse autotransporter beta domain-containing protein [Spirulina sp.]